MIRSAFEAGTAGLVHPSPIEIRGAIMDALYEEQDRRKAAKLDLIPWNIASVISRAIAKTCEAHYAKQDASK